jgi:hypothetical protein
MRQYVQADLEADRQVANTLAELIIGGSLSIRGPRDRARLHRRHYRGVSRIPLAERWQRLCRDWQYRMRVRQLRCFGRAHDE